MKNIKDKTALIAAARVALQTPAAQQFWTEVEQRAERREATKKELVEPRKTRTI